MKLVIDSNQLQSVELRKFLARSNNNFAVLTDYAAMEAYKGDTLSSIFKSMSVLADYPSQVIILKGTRAACGRRGRTSGLQRRLIDEKQTNGFYQFVACLRLAQQGNSKFQKQLLENGHEATNHLNKMLVDAATTGTLIEHFAKLYSKEDRANFRRGENLSNVAVNKTIEIVLEISGNIFKKHPDVKFSPKFEELGNTFIFRMALGLYLLVIDWAAQGGARDASHAKLRNDFVDMIFATYSTYFDGLLSADAKVRRLHGELRLWLSALFGCNLPGGVIAFGTFE